MNRTLLRGKKFSDSHQTVIDPARDVINFLKKMEEVKKIVIGHIKNQKSKIPGLKTMRDEKSIELVVKGRGEIQRFYIFGENLELIENELKTYH